MTGARAWHHLVEMVRQGPEYEVGCLDCPWGVTKPGERSALTAQESHSRPLRDASGKVVRAASS